ncbi:hypothetical protein [Planktothricoides sp. SR001]|uniref:hypothetical protein n=1 Tax=Planktothricoides sp. SR001 TaxID=1705388 RepID=UPI0012E107CE|nr:hypothetical protein [Planktothricoides sp. SR001]
MVSELQAIAHFPQAKKPGFCGEYVGANALVAPRNQKRNPVSRFRVGDRAFLSPK